MEGIFITELEPGDGIRLAVKDLFDTAGVRTTYGSAIFAEHVPDRSAEAVLRLEAAGYASVGKTNLHEFAYGVTSQNLHYGTVPNPAAPGRTAGGSSGGSAAALAAGLADAALGTDSGGSIRLPAACCAIAGFKPSFGLVPIDGVFPLAPSFDHAGPMARDVAGCATLMAVLAPELERARARPRRRPRRRRVVRARRPARARAGRGRGRALPALGPARLPGAGRHDAGVHARDRRRPSRALRRAGRAVRREHPPEDRALPRGDRGRGVRGRRRARASTSGARSPRSTASTCC